MKKFVIAGALAASLAAAGCANQGASMQSLGAADAPNINVKDNKRHEFMVGSRIARETRESPESIKSISRKGYQEHRERIQGSPLDGGG